MECWSFTRIAHEKGKVEVFARTSQASRRQRLRLGLAHVLRPVPTTGVGASSIISKIAHRARSSFLGKQAAASPRPAKDLSAGSLPRRCEPIEKWLADTQLVEMAGNILRGADRLVALDEID